MPPEVFLLATVPMLSAIAALDAFAGLSELVGRRLKISRELALLVMLVVSAFALSAIVNVVFSEHHMFAIVDMNDAEAELSRIDAIRISAIIDVVLLLVAICTSTWLAYRRQASVWLYVLASLFGNVGFVLWIFRNRSVR